MAEEKKPSSESSEKKPKKSSSGTTHKTEQPVMVDTVGVDIRKLLTQGSGKDFDDMTTEDFKAFAESKGVVGRDVKKMGRAFNAIKKNAARQYLVDTDGFNVLQENLPLTRSGRDIGNKKGLDLGDLVGLGTNVSMLAGFASRELPSYRKYADKQAAKSLDQIDTSQLTSVNPDKKPQVPGSLTVAGLAKKGGSGSSGAKGGKPAAKAAGPSADFESKINDFHNKYNKETPKGDFVPGGGSFRGQKARDKENQPVSQKSKAEKQAMDPTEYFLADLKEDMSALMDGLINIGTPNSEVERDKKRNSTSSVSFDKGWGEIDETASKPEAKRPKPKSARSARDYGSGSQTKGPGIQLKVYQ